MGSWTSFLIDALWRNALAVIPLVLIVAAACRWLPCRPPTRHALWLFILAWLVVPPMLPSFVPSRGPDLASDPIVRAPTDVQSAAPNSESLPSIADRRSQRHQQAPTPPWTEDSAPLHQPARLASAADVVGSLFVQGSEPSISHPLPTDIQELLTCLPRVDDLKGRLPKSENCSQSCDLPSSCSSPSKTRSALGDLSLATRIPPHRVEYTLPPCDELPVAACLPAAQISPRLEPRISDEQLRARAGILDASDGALTATPIERSTFSGYTPRRLFAELIESAEPWLISLINVRDAVGRLPAVPAVVWFTGIALIISCRILRILRVRGILARGKRAPAEVRAMVSRVADEIGLRQPPVTLVVPDRVSPMVWCGLTPRLILPRELWGQLDDIGRRAVLLHELAHVRRRDHWITWIETIVGSLYWWHPVVWWVRGRLREEAENCCDAWVTWLFPRGRRAFAEALLVTRQYVAEGGASAPVNGIGVISGRAGQFARRLTMVMTQRSSPSLSFSGIALIFSLASAGWLATPASSCPPSSEGSAPKAVTCASVETTAPCVSVAGVPSALPAPQPSGTRAVVVVGTPAPPVAAFAPLPGVATVEASAPAIPAIVTYSPPAAPSLSGKLMLAGPTAPPARRGGNVDDRLDRLERQLERLADQLERMGGGHNRARTQERQAAPRQPLSTVAPTESGEEKARRYQLSGEKLEKLMALMVRDDVPIKVRASGDGIEVIASHEQQMIFEAFVNMIQQPDDTVYYQLSPGKLSALTELMVLNDVPVMVHPGEEKIGVNGGGAIQTIFGAFVRMIDPDASVAELTKRRINKDVQWKRQLEKELHEAHKAHEAATGAQNREFTKRLTTEARAEVERALAEARRVQGQVSAETRMALKEAAKALKHSKGELKRKLRTELQIKSGGALDRARELEHQADELERKADQLRDQADSIRDRAESTQNDGEAARFLAMADELDAQASEIETQSEVLLAQADEIEEIAESIDQTIEQGDAHKEADAEDADIDEDVDADDDANDDADDDGNEE